MADGLSEPLSPGRGCIRTLGMPGKTSGGGGSLSTEPEEHIHLQTAPHRALALDLHVPVPALSQIPGTAGQGHSFQDAMGLPVRLPLDRLGRCRGTGTTLVAALCLPARQLQCPCAGTKRP